MKRRLLKRCIICKENWRASPLKTRGSDQECECKAYLKDFLIKYSSSKYDNSFSINDGSGASLKLLGGLLFTVQNEGDGLLMHTDGHSMPPGMGGKVNSHTYWVTGSPVTGGLFLLFVGSNSNI